MQPHSPYQMANTYHTSSSSTLSPNHTPHQFHHLQHCDYPHSHHNQHSHQFFQQQPQHLGMLDSSLHPQEQSTTTASFWKAFNTVLSDAKGKHQEVNENIGDLEDVYKKGRNEDASRAVMNEWEMLATETVEVEGGGARRSGKRRRKKREEEKMVSFFKRLVKRVVKQQEVLQNKLVATIERMEKERAEWEEGWRRREAEIHDREALMKARERDLASKRDSSIVSSLEKITGQRFVLVSGKGHDQLSTIHEN
ncbi:uncharacterized protein LOC106761742 [Vigna radiata var. radiata]|uniref:Uncharacterized protein LOC106761742 n=1 Tax=Vigna radiata var. radiata TaxID=3916 RepID=A0A1S3U444_VIGRR|nr:uncharacterized protein LOC106761742 [Vigna radiata var. radiata]